LRYVAAFGAIVACATLLCFPFITHADITSGLVGHWTFDGSDINWATGIARDSSGQGNNGSLIAMSTTTSPVAGKLGQAITFNGTQANLVEADSVASAIKTGDVSFTAWIKFPSRYDNSSPAELIIRNADGPSDNDVYLEMNSQSCGCGALSLIVIDHTGGQTRLDTNTGSWNANQWYFIAGTYASSTGALHVYVNGVPDDSATVNVGTFRGTTYSTHFMIGGDTVSGINEPFNGAMDDVRVYNRALGAAEIAKLYHSGAVLVKPPNNLGLIGYWPMNEGTGKQAGDFSGNGHPGALSTNGGTLPAWVNGRRGAALGFNGTDSYVSVGNTGASLQTISFWAKANVTASKKIMDFDGGTHIVELNASSQVTATGFASPTVYVDGSTASAVVDTGWHFITITTATPFTVSAMDIGRVSAGYFSGKIDDVRVYNRALSATDVANLYDQGTAGATQIGASSATLDNGTSLGTKGGLVGHWTFDGADFSDKIYDRSGLGNDGYIGTSTLVTPTSTRKVAGKLGQALSFSGSNRAEAVETDGVANQIQIGDITYAAWIKFNAKYDNTSKSALILRLGDLASGNDVDLDLNAPGCGCGALGLILIDTVVSDRQQSNTGSWKANTWYFVAGTYTSSTGAMHVYVNGVQDDASVINAGHPRNSGYATHFFIGGDNIPGDLDNEMFNGTIDDARVYNRALSAAEIYQLYKLGTTIINK
jgi:hypothetical protein